MELAESRLIDAKNIASKHNLNRLLGMINVELKIIEGIKTKVAKFNVDSQTLKDMKEDQIIDYLESLKDVTSHFF